MAGGAVRLHRHHQCVVVTVGGDGNNVLIIAAGFPLQPKLLTGAAVETGKLLFHGDFQTLRIHICQGKYFICIIVNNDSRDQTSLVKF